jgi:two-component system, NarL family, nitrate/nitrite response regulator NarL
MHRPVRVVIADDHPLYRDGVARAISDQAELELVGQAADGWGALFLIKKLEPDVALVDLKMPGVSGIELCARLRAVDPPPRTRVVLLSAYLEPELVSRAGSAGAAGYLGKDGSRSDICQALLRVGHGSEAYSPAALSGLLEGLGHYAGRWSDTTDA